MWYALNFVMFDQPSKIQIRSCINIERSIGSASNQIVLDYTALSMSPEFLLLDLETKAQLESLTQNQSKLEQENAELKIRYRYFIHSAYRHFRIADTK